ncbi:MAG TPA: cytochrome c oxidase subunit 3 [Terriglobales bacterium]|jgi:cytochrome c oxidase subunit 3|nr:cytochrome c oxidase subunit 3 [Terriglobales bacterium]
MATFSPTIRVPQTGQDGGGTNPPVRGGGGDGGRGDGYPDYGQRLRRVRLGLAIGLTSVTMIFVSLTSAYIVRRGLPTYDDRTGTYTQDWIPVQLPLALLLINTVLLAASSVTAELARRQITRQAALAPVTSIPGVSLGRESGVPWLAVTVVLGMGFLTGQWLAWRELADRGFYLATSASSSFVYLLTATHGMHLLGGVLVLLYAATVSLLNRPVEGRRIVVDVTAWYWHFMFVLWIGIFALMWFVR